MWAVVTDELQPVCVDLTNRSVPVFLHFCLLTRASFMSWVSFACVSLGCCKFSCRYHCQERLVRHVIYHTGAVHCQERLVCHVIYHVLWQMINHTHSRSLPWHSCLSRTAWAITCAILEMFSGTSHVTGTVARQLYQSEDLYAFCYSCVGIIAWEVFCLVIIWSCLKFVYTLCFKKAWCWTFCINFIN